jgi:hypothetical protein
MNRPDVSFYLAHFTSGRQPVGNKDESNPAHEFSRTTPIKRLENILRMKTILATTLPWTGKRAVCFTECPWTSLIDHTKRYSSFGIGFNKKFIFVSGGGPVYYVRADYFEHQKWSDYAMTFVSPFWPKYRSLKNDQDKDFPQCDYTHEREWRLPHDLKFEYSDIEFIIMNKYVDMAKFPQDLKDAIGRDKFLLMENYKKIETLWPVHNLNLSSS